ncbi:MAG: restriction endonuclease, partial [Elusimicrobiota bacterium]|nr:restriction endonuclease [Endomicrobiia bacterium]MDW7999130.1 restriction endonuclease [Thermodesulfovibrio sp.]MDW8166733.1 restriction endonuclease [Elusimicrobiota bacterium]
RYQFQWWALSLINARPYGDKKKGADTGIDGYIYFPLSKTDFGKIIVSVKSGKVSVKDIRDLVGVMERENAKIGIFITLEKPTKNMKTEAIKQGFFIHPLSSKQYQRLQIITIEELLNGKRPEIPQVSPDVFIKKASSGIENIDFDY